MSPINGLGGQNGAMRITVKRRNYIPGHTNYLVAAYSRGDSVVQGPARAATLVEGRRVKRKVE
jgi:hypothetical protein